MQPTLPVPLLSRLSDMLAARIGLHFPAERWGDLERGIASAASAFGMADAKSCAHRLLSAPLTHREIEILASCLTVGETYFFREKQSFEALEQHILPALLQARAGNERRLRIWSAGCCTGEEPYSIAMLLDRLIPNADTWNITLLATDINPAFLRKAAEGEYGEWSFRGTPDWIKERYFRPQGSSRFKLDERIRRRVTFAYLNLADDTYPSLTNNTNAMDVIFCRNVLMYFTPERAEKVAGNLHQAALNGGWLNVSPAETSNKLFSGFSPVVFPGAVFYRKVPGVALLAGNDYPPCLAVASPPEAIHPMAPVMPLEFRGKPPSLPAAPRLEAARPALDAMAREQDQTDALCATARLHANQGKLVEAVEWCEKAIASDKLNPQSHYLLATIRQELGQPGAAEQSLKRALYLEPGFVLAYFALGNLRLSQGRNGESEHHFRNALALLQKHPRDEPLPESDGLTAGRLLEIIMSILSSLPQPAAASL